MMCVGNKVIVTTTPDKFRSISPRFVVGMDKYCGKVVTISRLGTWAGKFQILEDGGEYWWAEWFVTPMKQRTE